MREFCETRAYEYRESELRSWLQCFVEYDARPAESSGQGESTGALYAQFRDVRNMPTNDEIARYFSQYGAVSGVYESSHPLYALFAVAANRPGLITLRSGRD